MGSLRHVRVRYCINEIETVPNRGATSWLHKSTSFRQHGDTGLLMRRCKCANGRTAKANRFVCSSCRLGQADFLEV